MEYLGLADLLKRWIYSRQGLYKLMRRKDFPAPEFAINGGRTKVWYLADIKAFEAVHPEVASEAAKHSKVRGYAVANLKKQRKASAV